MSGLVLYDYQQDAVDGIRAAYAWGCHAPLLVLPTGGGKTVVFTYIAAQASKRGRRILLLAHRRELVGQISAALKAWGVDHGIISPSAMPTNQGVQVAMAQTLARRVKLDKVGRYRFDLVVVDEAHHATPGNTWGAILDHNGCGQPGGAKLLGVTATPCRLDGKGLGIEAGGFFDELIVGPSVEELIARGRLAQPVVFAPEFRVNLQGVKKHGGDYRAQDLSAVMDKQVLTGNAVEHYRERCAGAPAIAFTVTVEHAGHVAEQFKAGGFSATVLTGSTPDRERAGMIRDLGAGRLNVLCSCNVVSEGTDIPTVTAAILLRPTASFALAIQQMGRALRVAPGKDRAILLDHAGNTHKHGLPTDPVDWSLTGMARKGKGLRQCAGCKATISAMARRCPSCGATVYGMGKGSRAEEQAEAFPFPEQTEGRLVEVTPEMREKMREWRRSAERRAKSLEDFKAIGQAMGYKPGWAHYRYLEMSGRGQT